MSDLPVLAVLPDLCAALERAGRAVLIAPPGAGKTTAVAPALLGEAWCTGTVILLSPRRVAARAAAERMAELLGEQAGDTVGYLTRLDSKRSARTRILVMTEAIFVSTILGDPELAGVSAVLFDEAHERHLDSDLGLALAIECREVLRPDLRLLVMSATIDGARFAALLGEAPVIESAGRAWPLDLRWLGARPELRIEEAMAAAILTAWREEAGDVLAFLPGVGEIERTARRGWQSACPASPLILPLHGQCEPQAQRAAIRRDPEGRRRIVLATAIAETSLTLDGVSVVVDAGLSRRAEFDKAAGVTRLVTHRASQAAAAQRAGRAARQGPGVAYRLWEEAAHAGRAAFDPPEMLTSDLAPLLLSLALWGPGDPAAMAWLDPPPAASLAAARASWQHWARSMPTAGSPPTAAPWPRCRWTRRWPTCCFMLRSMAQRRLRQQARAVAAGARAWRARRRPGRCGWIGGMEIVRRVRKPRASWRRAGRSGRGASRAGTRPRRRRPVGVLLAEAFPDNLARRRSASGEDWLAAGGRGLRLDPASPLARAEWLAVGEAQGEAKGARITGAIALTEAEVLRWLAHRIERRTVLRWVAAERRVEALVEQRLGAIVVASGPDPQPDPLAIRAFLLERVREQGLDLLPLSQGSLSLLKRARYAGIAALSDEALLASLDEWLAPLIGRRLDAVDPGALHQALLDRLDHGERKLLDSLAPPQFASPAGTHHAIDYEDPGGPSVEVRVQALFGLDSHPMFGHPPQPLLLKLTSPGGKPIQTTRDLPGFWRGSWRDVVRDMKGRYPKHRWPDAPWSEDPSLKTRNAFEGSKRS